MHKAAKIIGIIWIALVVAYGLWLGFSGMFLGQGGIFFESGFGDIWVLAICGMPGYLLILWGDKKAEEGTPN